ncbi:MAG TPA: CbtB-domain containing protein [Conexibacter sp.]|nr:CbtB-domain containing protein [Conexibacter sp.]
MAATSSYAAPAAPATRSHVPTSIALSGGTQWMIGTVLFCVLLYYFIGVDQGATSIFGNDMHIHEFVHDARHLLGFPCH